MLKVSTSTQYSQAYSWIQDFKADFSIEILSPLSKYWFRQIIIKSLLYFSLSNGTDYSDLKLYI